MVPRCVIFSRCPLAVSVTVSVLGEHGDTDRNSNRRLHVRMGCNGMRGMSSGVNDEFCLTVVDLLLFCKYTFQELYTFLQADVARVLLVVCDRCRLFRLCCALYCVFPKFEAVVRAVRYAGVVATPCPCVSCWCFVLAGHGPWFGCARCSGYRCFLGR